MRPGITGIIIGLVVVIGVFAGIDALRSSGGEVPESEANAAEATTARTEPGAGAESSSELQSLRVVRLVPGRITTVARFVSFTVPSGWYGFEDEVGFVLARGLDGQALDLDAGGMFVRLLDAPFTAAARSLAQAKRLRAGPAVQIGGYAGRHYGVRRPYAVSESLANFGVPGDFSAGDPDLILLSVQGRALLIRPTYSDDAQRAEVYRVLTSFEFPDPKDEIERVGNAWAHRFGAGQRCNQFMNQPACEWVDCERVSVERMRNCTPVSSGVQRSFAGAVVEDIVVHGEWAAARFSNGETVRFTVAPVGSAWSIDRVGGGRTLFASEQG